MPLQDYLIVQDKQPTQYELAPKQEWRTLQSCSKFQSQSVHIYGYVFLDTGGQNHGQTLKTQWFFSNETCTDTHLLASCGKDSSTGTRMGKRTESGMSVCSSKTRIILVGTRG